MPIDSSVDYSTTFKLIGTQGDRQSNGALQFLPTRHDLGQRFAFSILVGMLGALLVGFMLYLESLPGTAEGQEYIALRGFEILGFVLLLVAIMHPFGWFRKRIVLSRNEEGALLIESRVWRTRRKKCPRSRIASIVFMAVPTQVQRISVDIDASDPRAVAARFWVWYVVIRLKPSGSPPRIEGIQFKMVATDEAPHARELPEDVLSLCQWLQQATGVPVHPAGHDN